MEISPQEKDIETNLIPVPQEVGWGDIVNNNGLRPEDGANKRQVFAQAAAPTINYQADDLWFDTDDNNTIYKANSALSWVSLKDGSIAGKITTFRQASVPTALAAGDLWTDTDDDNTYRATAAGDNEISAGEWVQVATLGATFGTDIAGGGSANTQVTNAGYATLFRYDKFGSGADGDKTVSGTETLTSDMNWNNLTVPTGTVLNAAGYRIRVKGTLTCAGTGKIINNGGAGGNGANGSGSPNMAGGAAGTMAPGKSLPPGIEGYIGGAGSGISDYGKTGGLATNPTKSLCSGGAAGGEGHNGSWGSGGAAGAAGAPTGTVYNIPVDYANAVLLLDTQPAITIINPNAGSGSGGGGGGNAGNTAFGGGGGGSGASGGYVWIAAKTIADGLNVEAKGGNGGNGGAAYSGSEAGGGGGSGGGGGGIIIIIYETIGTYTLTVTGGTKGTTPGSDPEEQGNDGGVGASYLIQV